MREDLYFSKPRESRPITGFHKFDFIRRIVLAVDTAGDNIAIGIARYVLDTEWGSTTPPRLETVYSTSVPATRKANTMLLTEVEKALTASKYFINDVDCVVVGRGPGSFTGVRIGVATAQGIARGLDVPLYGVSTTDALFADAWREGIRGWVLSASDAMRGEVYPAAAYLDEDGAHRDRADFVAKPDAAVEYFWQVINDTRCAATLIGSGLAKHRDALVSGLDNLGVEIAIGDARFAYPTGAGLIDVYEGAIGKGSAGRGIIEEVLPIYTRLSDAEETARQKEGQVTGAELMAAGQMSPSGVDEDVSNRSSVYLRALTPFDTDELFRLEQEIFEGHPPWRREHIIGEFDADNRRWYGLFEDKRMIGFGGISHSKYDADLLRIGVIDARQGKGCATGILARLHEKARSLGCFYITLEVSVMDNIAAGLYEKFGYKKQRVISRYSHGFDCKQMMCALGDRDKRQRILGIETSCDETAASVLVDGEIESNTIASQIQFHARFGGVVPEIASRKHIEAINVTVNEALVEASVALSDVDAIAVTTRPGLVGALVVGLAYAKGMGASAGIPLYGINHLEGHVIANAIENPDLQPPFVSLIVSGGTTALVYCPIWGSYETLGETLDDATGEAFDKVAKVLGLGYPGGPVISKYAEQGNPSAIDFPRAMMHSKDYRFSLSGLKTAVITYIHQQNDKGLELNIPDIAASFQQAVIDVQVFKSAKAVQEKSVKWFCIGGGVAANKALRNALTVAMEGIGVAVSVPPFVLCGDNAAMIAATAQYRIGLDEPLGLDAEASANAAL